MSTILSSGPALYREGPIPEKYDYLAPDDSEIRLLSEVKGAGLAHCRLPPGKIALAAAHKSVEEIWHFIDGTGEMWRQSEDKEEIITLAKGLTIVILPNVKWQFRCTSDSPLEFLIVTSPFWPGSSEAIMIDNYWPVSQ